MRNFNAALLDALDAGNLAVIGLIRFDWGEGSFGYIQREAALDFGGIEYQPLPQGILSVSAGGGTTGMQARGFTIVLSESDDDGLTPDAILQVETYDYRDRPVTVFDYYVDPDTGGALADPIPMLRGYATAIEHVLDPRNGSIAKMECQTRALQYPARNDRYRNREDQARRSASDRFFDGAATAGTVALKWGRKS